MKTQHVHALLCAIALMLTLVPTSVANSEYIAEPALELAYATKEISDNSVDEALSQHSLSQISHGLLLISILGLLAFKRR